MLERPVSVYLRVSVVRLYAQYLAQPSIKRGACIHVCSPWVAGVPRARPARREQPIQVIPISTSLERLGPVLMSMLVGYPAQQMIPMAKDLVRTRVPVQHRGLRVRRAGKAASPAASRLRMIPIFAPPPQRNLLRMPRTRAAPPAGLRAPRRDAVPVKARSVLSDPAARVGRLPRVVQPIGLVRRAMS